MAMDHQEKQTWIKVGVVFFFFLVAIIATPRFGLYARVAQLGKVHNQRLAKEKDLREKKAKVAQLDNLRQRVAEAEDQIAYFERRLPNSPEAPELFEQLKRIAWQTGLRYTSIDRLPPVEHKLYTEIPMRISLVVDYHGLGSFINRIESAPRFAKVDNIDIQMNEEDYLRQKVELNLSTFIFTQSEEVQPRVTTTASAASRR